MIAFSALAGKDKDKGFVGYVKYEIKTEGYLDAQEKAQQPTEMTISFSGPKARTEIVTPMQSQVLITNSEEKEMIILLDIMGNKVALTTGKEDFEKSKEEMPKTEVNITDETKEIAGYTCKKAEVITDGNTSVYWFTEDLKVDDPNWYTNYSEIKGVLLEYKIVTENFTQSYKAVEVKKKKRKDYLFEVPVGYKKMTAEEFQ
ncbi:MAG: hypothetical protein C0594_13570, partial [Marinilabiliales bacterium]